MLFDGHEVDRAHALDLGADFRHHRFERLAVGGLPALFPLGLLGLEDVGGLQAVLGAHALDEVLAVQALARQLDVHAVAFFTHGVEFGPLRMQFGVAAAQLGVAALALRAGLRQFGLAPGALGFERGDLRFGFLRGLLQRRDALAVGIDTRRALADQAFQLADARFQGLAAGPQAVELLLVAGKRHAAFRGRLEARVALVFELAQFFGIGRGLRADVGLARADGFHLAGHFGPPLGARAGFLGQRLQFPADGLGAFGGLLGLAFHHADFAFGQGHFAAVVFQRGLGRFERGAGGRFVLLEGLGAGPRRVGFPAQAFEVFLPFGQLVFAGQRIALVLAGRPEFHGAVAARHDAVAGHVGQGGRDFGRDVARGRDDAHAAQQAPQQARQRGRSLHVVEQRLAGARRRFRGGRARGGEQAHRAALGRLQMLRDFQRRGRVLGHHRVQPRPQRGFQRELVVLVGTHLLGQRAQNLFGIDARHRGFFQQLLRAGGEAARLGPAAGQQIDLRLARRGLGRQLGHLFLQRRRLLGAHGLRLPQVRDLPLGFFGAGLLLVALGAHQGQAFGVGFHRAFGFGLLGGEALAAQQVRALARLDLVPFVLQAGQTRFEVQRLGAQVLEPLAGGGGFLVVGGQRGLALFQLLARGLVGVRRRDQILLQRIQLVPVAGEAGLGAFRLARVALRKRFQFLRALLVDADQFPRAGQRAGGFRSRIHCGGDAPFHRGHVLAQLGRAGFGLLHADAKFFLARRMGFQLGFQRRQRGVEFAEPALGQPDVARAQLVLEALVALGLADLALQRNDLALHFLDDVAQPQQVRLGVLQLAQGLFLVGLVLADAAGLLEHFAAVVGARAEDLVDAPLLHHAVGIRAQARVHEQALDVLQAARGLVDEILAFAGAEHAARHRHLVVFRPQDRFAVGQRQAHLGHRQRLGLVGAVEDHVGHGAAAQRLRALFAQHPADRVRHVALAAAVRAHDRHHSGFEHQLRPLGEALEPDHFECF